MDTVTFLWQKDETAQLSVQARQRWGLFILKFPLICCIRDHSDICDILIHLKTKEDYKLNKGEKGLYGGNVVIITISKTFCVSVFILYIGATAFYC
jgi:hypothetical protein